MAIKTKTKTKKPAAKKVEKKTAKAKVVPKPKLTQFTITVTRSDGASADFSIKDAPPGMTPESLRDTIMNSNRGKPKVVARMR